jgi:hypothetical protein
MINLISYDKKAEIKAGRQNVTFLNLLFITAAAIILVSVLLGVSFAALVTGRDAATKRVEENQNKVASYNTDKERISKYVEQLSTTKSILDKEVNYSQILLAIGSSLPQDAIIQNLSIEPANFDNSLSMVVYSRTRDSMISVKNNMQKKPDIFSDVQFESVDFEKCTDSPDKPREKTSYDCEATLRVVFNKKVKGVQ